MTQIDPALVNNSLPLYALPNLVKMGTSWIFAITKNKNIGENDNNIRGDLENDYYETKDKILVTDGVNVQTPRGVIPYKALKPNIIGPVVNILPTDTGSRIGVMYVPQPGTDMADMHFIINGEDQGVYGRDIPYKIAPLYAVVDVYGATKQVRIVQIYGGEQHFYIFELLLLAL